MPNAFASLVLYSFPILVIVLFWKLPVPRALVISILGGYLFLPESVGIDLPVLPPIDKTLVPSLAAAIMCLLMSRKASGPPLRGAAVRMPPRGSTGWGTPSASETAPTAPLQRTKRGRGVFTLLFMVLFLVPALTVYYNPEPVSAGPGWIQGLVPYDVGSLVLQLMVAFLPFWLAQRFLARPEDHVMLLRAFVISGLGYSLLCLYEIRMSPQLNVMFYGFFPHEFLQHMRAGGFRPIVFLHHGLWLGIYLAMAILSAVTLFLWSRRNGKPGLTAFGWMGAALWLILVLFLSKAVGAFALVLLFVPVALMAGVQGQLLFAMIVAGVTLFYPLLRGAGWIPVDTVYEVAQSFSQERADSLKFRLDNEDLLLERAAEKPLAGWGSWGRNLLYESYSGKLLTIPDGAWIIIIGSFGWVGYIAHFGILTAPLFLLGLARRKLGLSVESSGLAMVLAINLMDLVPNATLTPLTYLVAGALCGRYALATSTTPLPNAATVAEGPPVRPEGSRKYRQPRQWPELRS
jgi:hypothetical protein